MTETRNISIDDLTLVQKCKKGDPAAMERLIVKYQDRVYSVILRICANPDDAAELTQETFVKFIEKVGSFRQESAFYTWLFRIAVNLTLNHCKRRIRVSMQSLESGGDNEDETRRQLKSYLTDENAADPAQIVANREAVQLLLRALDRLTDDQKAVIVLRDIEGMNYEEIAGALEIELGTVKSRLSRARANLRDILESVLS